MKTFLDFNKIAMKKDSIIQVLRVVIWAVLVTYSWWILYKYSDLVPHWFLYVVILLWSFIVLMGAVSPCIPKAKLIQTLFGVFLILFSYYSPVQDNPTYNIYIKDILIVLWVVLVIVWPTWLCITDKCKQKEEEEKQKEVEVIEV